MAADSRDWLLNRLTQYDSHYDDYPDTGADMAAASSVSGYAVHSLDDECCPAVVDKATFFGTLAFIAAGATYLVTLLLTNAVTNAGGNLLNTLTNLLNLNTLIAPITNAVTQGQAAITGLITAITAITGRSFSPAFMAGLEEFEHKIERLAEDGNAENDGSWISNVYHKFKDTFGFDDTNSIEGHAEIDGMEPPMLDERWGLGDVRTLYNSTANGTEVSVANGTEHSLSKRALYGSESVGSVEQDLDLGDLEKDFEADEYVRGLSGEEKCKAKFWKCTGKVVGGSMHYANEPGGVWGLAKKTMFRMAFHGKYGNVWNALMSVPEARAMKRCLNIQEECLGYEAIRAEAESEDKDRPRILVNPDFVENQDKSDGAEQYDPEEMKAFQKWLDSE